jgi:hypothetical protein
MIFSNHSFLKSLLFAARAAPAHLFRDQQASHDCGHADGDGDALLVLSYELAHLNSM